jgi:hypothetical protein
MTPAGEQFSPFTAAFPLKILPQPFQDKLLSQGDSTIINVQGDWLAVV